MKQPCKYKRTTPPSRLKTGYILSNLLTYLLTGTGDSGGDVLRGWQDDRPQLQAVPVPRLADGGTRSHLHGIGQQDARGDGGLHEPEWRERRSAQRAPVSALVDVALSQ